MATCIHTHKCTHWSEIPNIGWAKASIHSVQHMCSIVLLRSNTVMGCNGLNIGEGLNCQHVMLLALISRLFSSTLHKLSISPPPPPSVFTKWWYIPSLPQSPPYQLVLEVAHHLPHWKTGEKSEYFLHVCVWQLTVDVLLLLSRHWHCTTNCELIIDYFRQLGCVVHFVNVRETYSGFSLEFFLRV